ncbi:hypothetical protein BCR33DRAFT_827936, partial [Rhizoclosmatium globosum]
YNRRSKLFRGSGTGSLVLESSGSSNRENLEVVAAVRILAVDLLWWLVLWACLIGVGSEFWSSAFVATRNPLCTKRPPVSEAAALDAIVASDLNVVGVIRLKKLPRREVGPVGCWAEAIVTCWIFS